ncbi:protein kinase [Candidatus Vecturithrix granuli]|uniref:Protein kinase n=1 Tax=Vecturithrix granuli TaxID=1499967 RepID=A0A081BWS4_VECG1|nr:protein kinase [Candidatus Vecturithrix granuli]
MIQKEKGHQITYDSKHRILKLALWGFWDRSLGEQFRQDFIEEINKFWRGAREWHILADLSNYPPQSEEVQKIVRDAMLFAKAHGLKRAARVVDKMTTQLQFKRLSQEIDFQSYAFFHSEQEAQAWLLDKRNEG